MKAIKILTEDLASCLSLAEKYNKQASYALFIKDLKDAELQKKMGDNFLNKAKETQEALDEILELMKVRGIEVNGEIVPIKN